MLLSLKKWEPILFLDNHTLEKQLEELKNKENSQSEEVQKQIKFFEYGTIGEKRVLYELLNSHIGMYILHDINIKFGDLEAQIDFLIMTEKSVFVIECKNLYGNITIDSKGNFIRETEINGKKTKTGIYNPLTQCERHIGLLKNITYEKYGAFQKLIFGNKLDQLFTPIVVLANDKTILNDYYAPKNIKEKVIRADQLVNYIKEKDNLKKTLYSKKDIQSYCENLLKYQIESKYMEVSINKDCEENNSKNDFELREELKSYRLKKCKEENNRPYFIFNDRTLTDLIKKKPLTDEELIKIEGFGQYKIEKYGEDILNIIRNSQK